MSPYDQFHSDPYNRFVRKLQNTKLDPEPVGQKVFRDYVKPNNDIPSQEDFTGPINEIRMPEYAADDPLLVNLGAGMKRVLGGMTRLVLPKALEPNWVSDEARIEDQKARKSLEGTPGSTVMQMTGETIPTLPVGIPNAARNILLQTLSRGAPALEGAARVATSRPVQSALEGAGNAAANADVGQEDSAALFGGGLGGGMSVLGKVGGAMTRGLVKKSQAAKDLEHLAGQHGEEIFLPLAQAATDEDTLSRMTKAGYRELLPMVPGTSERLENQAAGVTSAMRRIAANEAAPVGMTVPKDVGDNIGGFVRDARREFNKRYADTIEQYVFNVPTDFRQELIQRIKQQFPKIDDVTLNKVATEADQHMARFSSGQPIIDGKNMLEVKNAIGRSWGKSEGVAKGPIETAQKYIDEIISTELKQGGRASNMADLAKYNDLTAPYRSFLPLAKAAKSAKPNRGNFSPNQLARASGEGSEMLDLAQTTLAATKDKAVGRGSKWVGAGGLIGTSLLTHSVIPAMMAVGGAQMLSTKTMQKALMGDLAAQKMVTDFLENNPTIAEDVGRLVRNTSTTQLGSEYGTP